MPFVPVPIYPFRGGLAFFTALKGTTAVLEAALEASRATPVYVSVDTVQCKAVIGEGLTADQLAKPNAN